MIDYFSRLVKHCLKDLIDILLASQCQSNLATLGQGIHYANEDMHKNRCTCACI